MNLDLLSTVVVAALTVAKDVSGAYSIQASTVETGMGYPLGTIAEWWPSLAPRSDVIAALQAAGWNFHSSGTLSRFYR